MSSIGVARVDNLNREMAGRVSTTNPAGGYRFGNAVVPADLVNSLIFVSEGRLTNQTSSVVRCLMLVTLLLVGLVSTVLADGTTNLGVTDVGAQVDQTFYAYANPGERVTYSFTRSAPADAGGTPANVTIYVYSPLGLVRSQTLTTIGQSFSMSEPVTASTTGIWTIVLDFTANYQAAFLSPYNVDVTTTTNVSSRINGRVYTDILWIRQNNGAHPIDINLYMISEFGYKYNMGLRGYMGFGSYLQTTRYGLRRNGTCVSNYRSEEVSAPYSSNGECGGLYKQFFTPIDASMPATSQRYDVATAQTVNEWLQPPVAPNPTISGLTYTPSTIGNPASGVFTAMIANYAGNANLQVDVNNNGVYTDAIDRTIPFNVLVGQNSIGWDGVDGAGNVVGCSTNLRARIYIDKVAEIHFTYYDLEQLSSGLRVTRINGTGSPSSTLYWDDSQLALNRVNTTPVLDGRAGINSTPNATVGVHGWAYNQNSWGNNRQIENWTYLPNLAIQQAINFSVACDLGDAPNSYATLLANNGPAHKLTSSIFIGALAADGELNGIPTVNASGDDANGVDDEDAITTAPPVLVACSDVYSLTVPVTNTTGQIAYLRGWVDFNRNGIFDTNEFTSVNVPYDPANTTTMATLMWGNLGAVGLSVGQSYIRLRVSTTNFVVPTGTLNDGEVEDYPVTILPGLTFSAQAMNASSCAVADGSITLTATGSSGSYEYSLNGVDFTPFTSPFIIPNLGRNGYRVTVRDQTFASCIGDTIININAPGCCDFFDNQTITGTAFDPGAGITVRYLLTNASGQILSVQTTPSFPAQQIGDYYIYTLAYDTGSPAPTGVTVGQNINGIAGCCYRLYPPDPITVCGCASITLIGTGYQVCAGQTLPVLQVTTTAVSPSEVEFVYFTTPQSSTAAIYGTPTGVLGSAAPISNTATLTDVAVPTTAGTYYIYARLSPAPADPSCRPYAQIPLSVSACTPPCDLTATASVSSTTVCVGSTITLSANATPAGSYTYTWSGPNGYVGTGANPTIASATLNNSGTYTVTVTDIAGCSATATVTVSVTVCCDLVASVAPTSVTSCSSPNTGALTISYTGTGSYQYTLNGGALQTLGASPVTISNLVAGSYTILVQTIGDPTCSKTLSTTIASPDTPPIFALSNSPLCTSSTLSLSATGAYTSYHWSGPNGFSSTLQNPTIPNATTIASGVYTVSIVGTGGCTASASTTVIIANQPSLTVTAAPSQTICSGQSTTLSVGGSNGAPVTWTNNLGQSGTGTTINFPGVMNLSGQPVTITYVIGAVAGPCSDSKTVDIVINPAPILQVIPRQAVVCALEQTQIVAIATPSTALINWTRTPASPAPASGSGTGTVTVNQSLPAGNYTYSFTATAGGCTSSPVVSQLTVNN